MQIVLNKEFSVEREVKFFPEIFKSPNILSEILKSQISGINNLHGVKTMSIFLPLTRF